MYSAKYQADTNITPTDVRKVKASLKNKNYKYTKKKLIQHKKIDIQSQKSNLSNQILRKKVKTATLAIKGSMTGRKNKHLRGNVLKSTNGRVANEGPIFCSSNKKEDKKNEVSKKIDQENMIAHPSVVMSKTKKTGMSCANISHKNNSGSDNWVKFLEQNKLSYKTMTSSTVDSNRFQKANVSNNRKKKKKRFTRVVALDCEMVGIGDQGKDNMLARVSIVNAYGDCLYDKFVKPREDVTDYRTSISGVRPRDLLNGEDFEIVQKEVASILENKIVVGHALKSDFDVLYLSHPRKMLRDTSRYLKEPHKGTPSLKKLTAEFLGVKIQEGEHNPIQDAKAALQLYHMFRKEWEVEKRLNHYCENKNKPGIKANIERSVISEIG